MVKNLPTSAGDTGDETWIPGLGRSHGKGNGNPSQYFCLKNPMDRGAWREELDTTYQLSTQSEHEHENFKSIKMDLKKILKYHLYFHSNTWKYKVVKLTFLSFPQGWS